VAFNTYRDEQKEEIRDLRSPAKGIIMKRVKLLGLLALVVAVLVIVSALLYTKKTPPPFGECVLYLAER
jgi:hypothetical protein